MVSSNGSLESEARALGWHSDAQLGAWQQHVGLRLRQWSENWGLRTPQVICANAWEMREESQPPRWEPLRSEGRTMAWLTKSDGFLACLSGLMFGEAAHGLEAHASGQSNLASAVTADAAASFAHSLVDSMAARSGTSGDSGEAPPESELRHWSGAVRVRILWSESPTQHVMLHVPSSTHLLGDLPTGRIKPSASRSMPAIQPLAAAIGGRGLQLEAHLSPVTLALADLTGLVPDDVVVTSHLLAAPLSLRHVSGTQAVFTARLAQRHGQKAVVLCTEQPAPGAPVIQPSKPSDMQPSQPASGASGASSPQWIDLPDAGHPNASAERAVPQSNPLLNVKVDLQVRVGSAVVTVGEFSQARLGQVFKLDRLVDGPVDLMLDGQVVARGQLVAVEDCFGVRLTELPQPLDLTPGKG